jgi:hypothetical protein
MKTEGFKIENFCRKEFKFEHDNENYRVIFYVSRTKGECDLTKKINSVTSANEVSDNIYKIVKNNSESIGMVFYMEDGYSEDPEENNYIHIPFVNQQFYPKLLQKILETFLEKKINQIVVGHEHGEVNKKCHLQTCIKFDSKLTKILNPGVLSIFNLDTDEEVTLLFMQQKARNSHALINYCQKDEDYELLNDYNTLKIVKNDKGKINVFQTLSNNRDLMSKEEAENFILKYDPVKYFANYGNIQKAVTSIFKNPLPPFEWKKPYIAEDYTIPCQSGRILFAPIFNAWFEKYCLKDAKRKKALCLFSKKRALGKTTFARSLVNDIGYILEYNNIFTDQNLKSRKENLKLLLLDDMRLTQDNAQTWQSMIAGERTTIRGFFVSDIYDLNLPCIITTNNYEMLTTFTRDPMYNTQIVCVEIDQYMGPPETLRSDLLEKEIYISDDLKEDLDRCEFLMEKKRNK